MITRVVGPEHDITQGDFEGDAEIFFDEVLPDGSADGAVIAREDGVTIGWLRFYWNRRKQEMTASGTWVEPEHRSKRVAQAVWARAIKHLRPKRVVVVTVTNEGRHLVGSIVRWFPKLEFDVR